MIIIVLVSIVGQYGLEIHEERGAGTELACYGAFLFVMGGSVLHAVRSLEEAEVYKKAFGVAFAKCAEGIEPDSDRLGPKPLNNPYVAQEGKQSADFYLAEAARLYEAFQRDVLGVLSDAADPTGEVITVLSNLKRREVRPIGGGGWGGGSGVHARAGVRVCVCAHMVQRPKRSLWIHLIP